MWLGKKGQYGISQENPQRLKAMRFTCNRIYKLARGKISLRSLLLLFFQAHLLTVVGVDCDCEPTPQMRDFMDWKLEKDGDHERLEEHRFSMALKVVNDLAIFSSSKVIRAFWKSQKRDSAIKIHSVASCFQSRTFFLVLPRNTTLILAKKRHKTSSKKSLDLEKYFWKSVWISLKKVSFYNF